MRYLTVASLVASLASACASDAPTPASFDFLPAEAAPHLTWTACSGAFLCSRLEVPIDYAKPNAGTLTLALKRLPARSARLGALLINPGGPGASALDYLENFASTAAGARLAERFDLVAVDPRGVGESTPLNCHASLKAWISADPSPDNEREWEAIERAASTFAAECGNKHGALLPHLGTANVARDMDQVRAAMGEEKLNFLGFSYGTAIGALYAELFPERVRALVLDGAVDLTLSGLDMALAQGTGFEASLERYFAWCNGGASRCTWSKDRAPRDEFAELKAQVERTPLPAKSSDRPAGPGEFTLAVAYTLYGGENSFALLSSTLSTTARGDGNALVRLADLYSQRRSDGSYPNLHEVNNAVNCLDHPAPSVAEVRREASRFASAAPTFGLPVLTQQLVCSTWPVSTKATAPPHAHGAAPILVIGTLGDPATPYAWAQKLALQQLESGVLLTYEGTGHTVYGRGVACIEHAVEDYLTTGTAPQQGTRCSATAP